MEWGGCVFYTIRHGFWVSWVPWVVGVQTQWMWGIMWIVGGLGLSECRIFGGFRGFEGSRGRVDRIDLGIRGCGFFWKYIGHSWICAVEGFWTQPDVGCKCNMV
jgi:hypothetical protein